MFIGMGIAVSDCTTNISHASAPIARRRRERDNWRSEKVIFKAYSMDQLPTTAQGLVADYV